MAKKPKFDPPLEELLNRLGEEPVKEKAEELNIDEEPPEIQGKFKTLVSTQNIATKKAQQAKGGRHGSRALERAFIHNIGDRIKAERGPGTYWLAVAPLVLKELEAVLPSLNNDNLNIEWLRGFIPKNEDERERQVKRIYRVLLKRN